MKKQKLYIEFLNKKKNFRSDVKRFTGANAFDQATIWGEKNLENFNVDMIKYE